MGKAIEKFLGLLKNHEFKERFVHISLYCLAKI